MTEGQAYHEGLAAHQRGDQIADMVYRAMASWPGSARELAGLIACACLGFCSSNELTVSNRIEAERLELLKGDRVDGPPAVEPEPSARSAWTVRATNGWEGNGR